MEKFKLLIFLFLLGITPIFLKAQNLALNKPVTVSSSEAAGTPGNAAVDGDLVSRWSSAFSDPQWIYVDLGSTYNLNRVKITWETALGKDYQIQVSSNTTSWTTIKTVTANTALVNDHTGLSGSGRYLRIYGTARATPYGYSIYELEAYASSNNLPPSVSITSPANNASFSAPANIAINANASDDGSISQVAFYNGATLLGTDTSSPYTFNWTNVPSGAYSITAKATDNLGAVSTSAAVNISVNNAANLALNHPTTVSSTENVANPGSNAVDGNAASRWSSAFSDPQWIYVDLGASYNINRVKISWEAAYGKDYQIQLSANASTWTTIKSITGNTTLVNDYTGLAGSGRYLRLYGTARGTGYGYSIYELEIYGSTGNLAPTVSVSSPSNGASFSAPGNITINANASDPDGSITQVAFYNGAALLGTDTSSPYTFSWANVPAGNYSITAKASDNGGVTTTSSPVSISVVQSAGGNLALNKATTVSSTENAGTPGSGAVDGNLTTRWSSSSSDPQWIYLDLGATYTINYVKISWETALAKDYQIQTSSNASNWTTIKTITGNTALMNEHTGLGGSARYLRIYGTARGTQYGYSIYELEVYSTNPAPISVPLHIPYVQYLDLGFAPADLNGIGQLITQNTNREANLSYNSGTSITIKSNDYRGEDRLEFWTLNQNNDTIKTINGAPLTAIVFDGMQLNVRLVKTSSTGTLPIADAGTDQTIILPSNCATIDGSKSSDPDGTITAYSWATVSGPSSPTLTGVNSSKLTVCNLVKGTYVFRLTVTDNSGATGTDEVNVVVSDPVVADFQLVSPSNASMITTTRRPTFTWNAVSGASRYDVYVNISRTDYDWYASGNFLDRFTKVGESTSPSYTMASDLTDRWTYKWYVIAITSNGNKTSNKLQFSVYIPTLEQEADGINIVGGARDLNKNGSIEPYEDWRLPVETRVNDLMSRLTLDEKYRQAFYGGDQESRDGFSFSYGVESGMRTVQYNAAKTRLGIPIAFLGDKIHGWKTIYPTELGLAAARDMNLVYRCGNLQRIEHKSFGFTGTLCPLAEVDTKVLYPRFQEGCGENADEAAAMVRAIVVGMQGGPEINPHSLLITVKHWPGQGAGGENALQYDATTIKYHMKPWYAAVEANAASVMPGYNTAPFLDPENKGANSSKKIIDYLRNEIQFKGFVVTDWLAANTAQSIESMGAGIDVMGGAPSTSTDVNQLVASIGQARLDEAVRRVLDVKFRLGMFENPYGDPTATWTNVAHHAIALEAAKKSITLLKNDGILPLKLNSGDNLIVGGPRATWVNQDADPNVIWQSIYYNNPQAKNYLKAFQDRASLKGVNVFLNDNTTAKVAIVVIGEQSYTHGTEWADKNPAIPADQLSVIQGFKNRGIPVVTIVLSPRPYLLSDVLTLSNAVMLVYRGGNGIAQASAELSFGDFTPSGKLPFQLPRNIDQIGTDNVNDQKERWELPYDLGATDAERQQIRNYIVNNQPVPSNFGNPLLPYGYGLQNFNVSVPPARLAVEEDEYNNLPNDSSLVKATSDQVMLYPNPVASTLHVVLKEKTKGMVEIRDLRGNILYSNPVKADRKHLTIDLKDLQNGMYIFRMYTKERVIAQSFIKE